MELDETLFVCPSYLQTIEGISVQHWKYFFQFLGVHESICLMPIDDNSHNELVAAYISAHTINLPSYTMLYGFKNRITILYIELTQINYQFAIVFWEHVIRSISVHHLNEPETMFTQRRNVINNLPKWCVRTRPCIPTTTNQLLPSTEVFSNNLRTFLGAYLPAFVCNVRTPLPEPWQIFLVLKLNFLLKIVFHY